MGTGNRTYLKVWCEPALNGVIHDGDLCARGVFWTLCWLVGNGNMSDYGVLGVSHRLGYSDDQIAELLNCDPLHWQLAKLWLRSWQGERRPLIAVIPNNVIAIVHWAQFQPEYNRQKKYRHSDTKQIQAWLQQQIDLELQRMVTAQSYTKGNGERREKR